MIAVAALALFGAGAAADRSGRPTGGGAVGRGSAESRPSAPPPVTATVTVRTTSTTTSPPAKRKERKKHSSRVTVTARVTLPAPRPEELSCLIDYDVTDEWADGFDADVNIRVFGDEKIDGWILRWTFPDNRRIVDLQDGDFGQNGRSVSVTNSTDNGFIREDESADFSFEGVGGDPDEEPTGVTLNGFPCAVD